MIFKHAKIMKDECDSKYGKRSFTVPDTAEPTLILYKDTKFQILYTQNILYMRYMHTEYYNCS